MIKFATTPTSTISDSSYRAIYRIESRQTVTFPIPHISEPLGHPAEDFFSDTFLTDNDARELADIRRTSTPTTRGRILPLRD